MVVTNVVVHTVKNGASGAHVKTSLNERGLGSSLRTQKKVNREKHSPQS